MNKKILTLAVTAALVTPMTTYADVKLSGLIQAEAASWEAADGNENAEVRRGEAVFDSDRQTLTNDSLGTIFNEGPNHVQFDLDEKLGNGLTANARYVAAFNTSDNNGFGVGEEAWIGLKTTNVYFRYGKLTGAYKSSHTLIDPWAFTSLQARGTAGGMSGGTFNHVTPTASGTYVVNTAATANGGDLGLTNEGFIEGALEAGVKFGDFYGRIQGVVDDASNMDGAGLVEFRYTVQKKFSVWLAGAYTDLDDARTSVSSTISGEEEENEGFGNWKIGGVYNITPAIKVGLQYEEAELGAFDGNLDGGKYILGSFEFNRDAFTLAAWIGGYLSNIEEASQLRDNSGELMDEDAINWALGGKYHFSKRTQVYAGYRQADSDNDYRDENVFALGIRHSF